MSSFANFFLGFIAGEGSFQIDVTPKEDRAYNVHVQPSFSVAVYEQEIIEKIQDEFQFGNIRQLGEEWRFNTKNRQACKELISFIEENKTQRFESTAKHDQYAQWRDAVHSWNQESEEDMKKIVDVAYSIGKPNQRKRSKEDFYELIQEGGVYYCLCGDTQSGEPCERRVKGPNKTCRFH